MRNALLIIGTLALAGAAISGLLGFFLYPAKARRRRKSPVSQQQAFARAMFIIFIAGAFVALFFGLLMPP